LLLTNLLRLQALRRLTKVRIHPLFTIFLLLSALCGYFVEALTLFGIVVVHELGHIAAIKWFGWRLKEVKLLPFGGVAEVEELGNVPAREEAIVALAGPLQHVWMIGLAWVMREWGGYEPEWWNYFLEANVLLGLFNLLPILPLDGGRVMQCAFSYVIPYFKAIWYGSFVSLGLSAAVIGKVVWDVTHGHVQLNLIMISIFLAYSNWYSLRNAPYQFMRFLAVRSERGRSFIAAGTLAQPIVVTRQRQVGEVVKLFMREKYHLVYVMNEQGGIQGVLPEQRLLHTFFHEKNPRCTVSDLFM
jgi:stage IV sporulation protein FB